MKNAITTILFVVLSVSTVVTAQEVPDSNRVELLEKVSALFKKGDPYQVVEFLNTQGDPTQVATAYYYLIFDLYWQKKALGEMVFTAQAGIEYCLTKAQEIASDSLLSAQFRGMARVMAYNLASFTWPGWNEPGIKITGADLKAGMDAAKLTVRLTKELKEGPASLSMSYWALGIQCLAAGDYPRAADAFNSAEGYSKAAGDKEGELMNSAYAALVKIVEAKDKTEARQKFDEILQILEKLNTENGRFFSAQLKTALEVFSRPN